MKDLNAIIRHVNNPLDEQTVTIQRIKRAWLRVGKQIVCAYSPDEIAEIEKEEQDDINIAKNKQRRKEKGEKEYEIEEILDSKGKGKNGKKQKKEKEKKKEKAEQGDSKEICIQGNKLLAAGHTALFPNFKSLRSIPTQIKFLGPIWFQNTVVSFYLFTLFLVSRSLKMILFSPPLLVFFFFD